MGGAKSLLFAAFLRSQQWGSLLTFSMFFYALMDRLGVPAARRGGEQVNIRYAGLYKRSVWARGCLRSGDEIHSGN